ncbi:MAG: APC family permease [Mollicutes bacterium]|nr:APC family permease [Mollicutes bacterium]
MKKKRFRLFDAVLATVCIILVAESVAPAASIGNSQFFWWVLLLTVFFLPYGLISAELGSKYPGEGGMYDWVKKAFGKKWATRVAWYYWINYPLWLSSLAVLVTDIICQTLGIELSTLNLFLIQALYLVVVTIGGIFRIGENKWVVNFGAFFKVLFMCSLGLLGIYVAIKYGLANEYTFRSLFPTLSTEGIGFISVIIFNFIGFEVISTFANDLKDPKKEIPRAVIYGGILIAIFYLLPVFGISVAIPTEEISTSTGIIDSFSLLLGRLGLSEGVINSVLIAVMVMFIYTLIANIFAWNFGVNSIARYAAEDGSLPKPFKKVNKAGVPYMAAIINAIVALAINVIALFLPEDALDLFWTFFSFSLVTLLISFLPLFPTFAKLRKIDPLKEPDPKIYTISGGKFKLWTYTWIPFILLILGIFFTLFPEFNMAMFEYQWPLLAGVVLAIIIGELLAAKVKK